MRYRNDFSTNKPIDFRKEHLARLPDLPPSKQIVTSAETKEALVIYPIFSGNNGITSSIENHFVRSACWSRRTWFLFSDALELNIAVKFYVEESILGIIEETLEKCGVDIDKDVLLFNMEINPDPETESLGKKTSFFNDDQFSGYKWVLLMDCDMFLACDNDSQMPIFRYLASRDYSNKEIGVIRGVFDREAIDPSHKQLTFKSRHRKLWKKYAHNLVDDDIYLRVSSEKEFIPRFHGGLYLFPSMLFHKNYKTDCEWLYEAGKLFGNDETAIELWAAKGNEGFSLVDEFDVLFFRDQRPYKRDVPYFMHLSNTKIETIWRNDIDSYGV